MLGSGEGQASSLGDPNASTLSPSGAAGLPFSGVEPETQKLQITFIRRKDSSNSGITYSVEFSDTLATGSWAPNPSATESTVSIDATFDRVTITDSVTPTKRFARVHVTAD